MKTIERGVGPTVLLLHGTAPPESLYGLAEALAGEFRTVVPSLPGYGASAQLPDRSPEAVVDALVAQVDALELSDDEPLSLVGHSGGAYLALALACRLPERIGRIALLAPAHHIDAGLKEELPQFAEAARAGELGYAAVAPLWFSEAFAAEHPEVVRSFEAPYERDIRGMADDLDGLVHARDLRPQLGELRAPVYVRSGTADVRTPPEAVEKLADLMADVEIDWVDGAGHMVHVEDAEGTRVALNHFFERD